MGSLKNAILASVMSLGAIVAAPVAGAAEYEWKMATAVAENSYFYNEFVRRFVDNVNVMTDGEVEITPYGAGVIVPAFKVYDSVTDGLAEAGHSSPGYLSNKDPVNAMIAAFAGGMSAEAALHWLYEGGGYELWVQFREEEMGLHPLIVGMHGSELFAHSRKPIRTEADLKGLKHRTSGSNAALLKDYFGGNPISAPHGEIFGLLERGAIDSAEFATPSANVSDGYHEIAKYIIVPGVHTANSPWEFVVKKETWDALPANIQAKLEAAAKLATFESYMKIDTDNLAAMQTFRDNGNEIIRLDPALVQKYRENGRDWARKKAAEQKAAGNPWMERFVESYIKFQDDWIANSSFAVKDE